MRTTRLLTVFRSIPCISGGLPNPTGSPRDPPGSNPLPDADPPNVDPPGHVTCDACWKANPTPQPPLWIETCENITLPQTMFAGGNNSSEINFLRIFNRYRKRYNCRCLSHSNCKNFKRPSYNKDNSTNNLKFKYCIFSLVCS